MFSLTRNAARLLAASAAALLLASCGGSDNDTPEPVPLFSTTVVVGSSVTDTGNRCGLAADPLCFPVPPYAGQSAASNGALYAQIVAARYGGTLRASSASGTNFSVGGATTGPIPTDTTPQAVPSMLAQTEQFLQRVGFQANPQHLYIVDGAALGNNVRRVLAMIQANPALAATLPTQAVTQAATDVFNIVTRLYAAGARHVVVTNSINLALVPGIAGAGASAIQLATGMSAGYNGALATQVIPGLRAASPGLNLYFVDLGTLSAEIAANPAGFGLTNVQMPCYPFFSAPAAPVCASPNTYLWWDELHPTAAVHAIAAERVIAAIGR